jgi:hypothetical protein
MDADQLCLINIVFVFPFESNAPYSPGFAKRSTGGIGLLDGMLLFLLNPVLNF